MTRPGKGDVIVPAMLLALSAVPNVTVAAWIIRTGRTRARVGARELSLRTSRA